MDDRAALSLQQVQETKILQKVNQAHREAFLHKFPQQCEHILRLTAERLQACLVKREGCDIGDPETWTASSRELADLAVTLNYVYEIYQNEKKRI